jgi:hypothetical protein
MAAYNDIALRHAFLVQFNFASGTMYVWNGFRPLPIGDIIWQPVGPNGVVEQIEDVISDNVAPIVLKISGVDEQLLAKALAETNEVKNQLATIYDIFLDENWQPIGDPATYAVVRMDTLKITRKRVSDDSWECSIAISCENYLTNGPCPPYGRYTSADQWARLGNNNDLYFNYMPLLQNQRIRWPSF